MVNLIRQVIKQCYLHIRLTYTCAESIELHELE